MKRSTSALLLAMSLAVVSLVHATVSVDYDKGVDFSRFTTYAWGEGTPAPSSISENRIRDSVNAQLKELGLSEVDEAADLFVVTHVTTGERTQTRGAGTPQSGWYRRGTWGTSQTVTQVPAGSLIVDLIDTEVEELVFRGVGESDLKKSPDKMERAIDKVVSKIFKKYPAR